MKIPKKLPGVLIALTMVGLTGWLLSMYLPRDAGDPEMSDESAEADGPADPLVRLSDAKFAAAGIKSIPVTREVLQLTRTLPARFIYDDTRHVSVRAATDGVLETVEVKPGDSIQAGQTIAVFRSPAIGSARSDILSSQAELDLATKQSDWSSAICKSVKDLVDLIDRSEDIDAIRENSSDATLGEYRGRLLTAYSKARLSSKLSKSIRQVGSSGAISSRMVQQRESERQQDEAALEALVEQSVFVTRQDCQKAEADTAAARRNLLIARQTLATLIGVSDEASDTLNIPAREADLARVDILAPISGTIERKVYSAMERVTSDSELFVIADTSRLWVEADVRGRDWSVMKLTQGDPVIVTAPATGNERLQAIIHFLGREVNQTTGAIPLVARIENAERRYRPGLFARMEVPLDKQVETLAVAESAVIDLDGSESVFVEVANGYRPVTVETGARSGGLIEIRSGLSEGQNVVVAGAFVLKSELLLEGED